MFVLRAEKVTIFFSYNDVKCGKKLAQHFSGANQTSCNISNPHLTSLRERFIIFSLLQRFILFSLFTQLVYISKRGSAQALLLKHTDQLFYLRKNR